jgi:AbrB family looped-hinge helix DNA binding protein
MKEAIATLTSKGQLTVPIEVRRHLGLKQGDRVVFQLVEGQEVRLTAVEHNQRQVTTTEAALAEVIYVLSSKRLYNVARPVIRQRLLDILALPGLRLANKSVYRRALDLYASGTLDFTDCLIVARLEHAKITDVFSFDRDFEQISGITRIEP